MAGSAKPAQAKSPVGRKRNREGSGSGEFQKRLAEALAAAPTMRLVPGSVLGVQQSIVVRKDNTAGVAALNRFIDELRDSGFLQRAISRANLAGVEVAPK